MKVFHVSWNVPETVFHEMLWKKSFTVYPCFKAKVEEVKYSMTGEYNDDSKSILNKIGVYSNEDDSADDDVALMMMMKNYLK